MCGLALYLLVRPITSSTRKILFSHSFFAILLAAWGDRPRYFAASDAVAPPLS